MRVMLLVALLLIMPLISLTTLMSLTSPGYASAVAYTDDQIADAIYKAEGGKKASHPYGIMSVPYKNEADARRICLNTIRDNRKRYADYGHREYPTFLEFLASIYAPTRGKGITRSAKKLNGNWLRNVRFFLKEEQEEKKRK
ncbi:MAG: hypothetical protein GY800_02180 [Planctomycetes bacterium]|nr:hypothetical protein [Planctomycetota bacterium]